MTKIDPTPYLSITFDELDCYRLCQRVYADAGLSLPDFGDLCADSVKAAIDSAINGVVASRELVKLEAPETPCLVLMKGGADDPGACAHIGVYIGRGRVLHTTRKAGKPFVFKVEDRFWKYQIEGFYRYAG